MTFLRSLSFLLAIAGLAISGGSLPAAKPGTTSKPRIARPSGPSDAEVERDIRARFARSKISTDKFSAKVQSGIATLSGHTDVIQHKGTATRLAKNAGALAVVNNIEISQAAKDKAARNLESGRRRAQLKRGDTRSSQ